MTRDAQARLLLTVVLAAVVGTAYGYWFDLTGLWFGIPAGCVVGKIIAHVPLPRRLTEARAPTAARVSSTLPLRALEFV